MACMSRVSLKFDYMAETRPPHQTILDLLGRRDQNYSRLLQHFSTFEYAFKKIGTNEPKDPTEPYWGTVWLPPLDAISIYGLLAINRPAQYLEIGSGNSTKFARRSIRDNVLTTKITSIDPAPRAEIDDICDRVIRKPLQHVEADIFDLPENSMVFLDGSHRALQNSDVTVFFCEVLPGLKSGTVVGVHDIFLPFDYPENWHGRAYSEQYMLLTTMLFGQAHFEIIMPVAHVRHAMSANPLSGLMNGYLSQIKQGGGAFWFKVK